MGRGAKGQSHIPALRTEGERGVHPKREKGSHGEQAEDWCEIKDIKSAILLLIKLGSLAIYFTTEYLTKPHSGDGEKDAVMLA
ncbi:UNVERIFIED_CONTAM: hypothetical protein K2H54_029490 [Gekko kuhli]